MFHAIRLGRSPPPSVLTTPLPPQLRRRSSPELRSRQVIGLATAPADQSSDNMDDSKNTVKKTGDIMSHSFGEGYATRSDEEGFGGIYGGNRSDDDDTEGKNGVIHENHPEYDKSQGSEVKEKENSRHQTHANR
ncbi:uncharacterized protein LOC111005770 [Momordica charantia]|uniref:Uncharacterized protein LOC111005770 n=1 Tax=Momordica charantia TaxID=3673 RepID=A0A6J1BUB9_MOMCH|nr:uncharacterized protein LOC111005770 [Momordica charantia]